MLSIKSKELDLFKNIKTLWSIFDAIKYDKGYLDINSLKDANNEIIELLGISKIKNKIKKFEQNKKNNLENNFYKEIFRGLNNDELEKIKKSESEFLLKKNMYFSYINSETYIETLAKLYNLDETETGILNFYKKIIIKKILNNIFILKVKEIEIDKIYEKFNDVFFEMNKLLNLNDKDLFYLNLFLFPADFYKYFYNLYLRKSAKFLYNSYIEEFKKFNSIDILKVNNFNEISINENFNILNKFLGKDYLFKNLIDEEKYKNYLNLEKNRLEKLENLYNEFYKTGNGSEIIKNYNLNLSILNDAIDNFNLDVNSKIKEIPNFINEKNIILEKLNKTLENIDEKHKKNLTDKEIQNKIKILKSEFSNSSYFENYTNKIINLNKILSKVLEYTGEVEDEDNEYCNVSLDRDYVNEIFSECNEFLNEDEIKKKENINNLSSLKQFIEECLYGINLDEFEFEELKNLKNNLKNISIIDKGNSSDSEQEEESENKKEEIDIEDEAD